jgi:hypothetical protein
MEQVVPDLVTGKKRWLDPDEMGFPPSACLVVAFPSREMREKQEIPR